MDKKSDQQDINCEHNTATHSVLSSPDLHLLLHLIVNRDQTSSPSSSSSPFKPSSFIPHLCHLTLDPSSQVWPVSWVYASVATLFLLFLPSLVSFPLHPYTLSGFLPFSPLSFFLLLFLSLSLTLSFSFTLSHIHHLHMSLRKSDSLMMLDTSDYV